MFICSALAYGSSFDNSSARQFASKFLARLLLGFLSVGWACWQVVTVLIGMGMGMGGWVWVDQ